MHLSTAYFPPIQYFCKIIQNSTNIWIEKEERFQKQSYRNRCKVMNSNGEISLSIPLKKSNSSLPIKEIEIDYTEDWQTQHYRTLLAGYGSSPFFEFYIDDIMPIFTERTSLLWDLNQKTLDICCKLLQIPNNTLATSEYQPTVEDDFRVQIHPKKKYQQEDNNFLPSPYWQPFSDAHGFHANLSILDLIFNLGTEAEIYLLNCLKPQH